MKHIVTAQQMKYLDENTIVNHRIDQMVLMERAALSVVKHMKKYDLSHILVVCGSGNNGGDGIAIGRLLHLSGCDVTLFFAGNKEKRSEGCIRQWEIADSYGIRWINNPQYSEYTTIVDALFGVGLTRDITGTYAEVIQGINQSGATVIAVDMPSGVCADTGKVLGVAVCADRTVTFAYEKVGQAVYPGKKYCGQLEVEDIGIYYTKDKIHIFGDYQTIEAKDLDKIPLRRSDGNKGTFGKVLLIAGSKEMPGASVLCGQAILRTGAGMLKIAAPLDNSGIIIAQLPEAMILPYESEETALKVLESGLSWADVCVIGPGIGQGKTAQKMVQYVLTHVQIPLVMDADALNIVSSHMEWLNQVGCPCILTPHVGEMARLLQLSVTETKEKLLELAQSFAKEYQIQCICKDAVTCTILPNQTTYINETGNAGLATAGSGDVLTGILGGLLAIGTPWELAGALGVYLHGAAGDNIAKRDGMAHLLAGDLIKELASFRIGEKGGAKV